MKKTLAVMAAAAIVAMTGSAFAATGNLTVSATVINACSVTGGTIDFGTLTGADVTKNSSGVAVTCTKGDAYGMALSAGGHPVGTQAFLLNSGNTDTIAYSLSVPTLSAATGAAQAITIPGTILATAYATASAGTYQDTVVITVTP